MTNETNTHPNEPAQATRNTHHEEGAISAVFVDASGRLQGVLGLRRKLSERGISGPLLALIIRGSRAAADEELKKGLRSANIVVVDVATVQPNVRNVTDSSRKRGLYRLASGQLRDYKVVKIYDMDGTLLTTIETP
ncbi:hypothetical protein VTK26DRAFT_6630 [Humicola hyalothermophila]